MQGKTESLTKTLIETFSQFNEANFWGRVFFVKYHVDRYEICVKTFSRTGKELES